MTRISKYIRDVGLTDKDLLVGSNYISGNLGEEIYETATFNLGAIKSYIGAAGDVSQTSGTFTPIIVASTPSEFVISSYAAQIGEWVRQGNLVFCNFSIFVLAANVSGYAGSTSGLTICGWPYNFPLGGGYYQSVNGRSSQGFNVKVEGFASGGSTNEAVIGNLALSPQKQNTVITDAFILDTLKAGDFGNANFFKFEGSVIYETNTDTLNTGAAIS